MNNNRREFLKLSGLADLALGVTGLKSSNFEQTHLTESEKKGNKVQKTD